MLLSGLFHHLMSLDPCVLVENITVNFRFLRTILKEGAGDVFVWPTDVCHIYETHCLLCLLVL